MCSILSQTLNDFQIVIRSASHNPNARPASQLALNQEKLGGFHRVRLRPNGQGRRGGGGLRRNRRQPRAPAGAKQSASLTVTGTCCSLW
jgi:hypothetical protein